MIGVVGDFLVRLSVNGDEEVGDALFHLISVRGEDEDVGEASFDLDLLALYTRRDLLGPPCLFYLFSISLIMSSSCSFVKSSSLFSISLRKSN